MSKDEIEEYIINSSIAKMRKKNKELFDYCTYDLPFVWSVVKSQLNTLPADEASIIALDVLRSISIRFEEEKLNFDPFIREVNDCLEYCEVCRLKRASTNKECK